MRVLYKIKIKNNIVLYSVLFVLLALGCNSCDILKKDMDGKLYQVSNQQMMDEILENKLDTFSSFLKIIDLSGLRGTIHAYGTYTLFAPTNSAVDKYLTTKGVSLSSLSVDDAANIVKYHLIADTISTSEFVDGRLPSVNFCNRYITSQTIADSTGGVSVILNRQAKLLERDLRGANGYVHVVNNVLSQSNNAISDVIKNLPENYSLWKEVYNKSNIQQIIDSIQTSNADAGFTCFVQNNDAYTAANIHNLDDLMTELRAKSPGVGDDQLLINAYVAYHLVSGFKYVVDLMNQSSIKTLANGEVIILKNDISKVLLNEFFIGGVLETGVAIDRNSKFTDLSCSNGVIQDISGNIQIIKRRAFRVYWDITEQPELMALKNYRKAGTSISLGKTDLAGVRFGQALSGYNLTYKSSAYPTTITKDNNYANSDYFYFRFSTNTINWIEFTTPVLVPGTYKVWFTYRGLDTSTNMIINTTFMQDGQDDQNLGVITTSYNKTPSSYGLTQYNNEFFQKAAIDGYRYQLKNSQGFWNNANTCQALGIIKVFSTGQHTLHMVPLSSHNFTTGWDQILFIPIDEDQIWPMQDIPGKLIYDDTPNCQIFPYSDCPTIPSAVKHKY